MRNSTKAASGSFKDLHEGCEYLIHIYIRGKYETSHIKIIEKLENACLVGFIDPNTHGVMNVWYEYNKENYSRVIDYMRKRNRSIKLKKISKAIEEN